MGPKRDKKLPTDCFICSEDVLRAPRYIAKEVTKFTKTPFTQVLSQVLDDEFYVVAAETDVVCKKCSDLINLRDKTSKILADSLKQKYKLRDGNEDVEQLIEQLVTSPKREIDSQNSFCDEAVEGPPEETLISPEVVTMKKPDGIEILASICESQLLQESKADTFTTLVKFLCEFCEFSGTSSKVVLDHIKQTHNEIMNCDLCSCKFRTKAEITHHMMSVHNFDENTLICLSCKAQFCNFDSFEAHKTPYIKGIEHYCKVCDTEFLGAEAYTNHCTQKHGDLDKTSFNDNIKVLYICKCCGQKFLDYCAFGKHCTTHKSLIASKVDHSSTTPAQSSPKKMFLIFQKGTTANLQTNKAVQNSAKKIKRVRKISSKRIAPPVLSLSLIHNSKNAETSTESRKVFECGICSIRMTSSDDLKDHFKTHATFNLPCKDCNLPFYSLSEYKLHQNYHWKEGMIATCESCETVFKQKCDMINHIKTIHKWTLACEFCGQQFYNKSKLVVHEKRHPESKSFVCCMCESRFRTLKCLTQHMDDIHTTPTCIHCSKTYSTVSALKKHECSLNATRALLKCSFCSKQFKSRSGKRDHELTHTGEHKFKCEECKRSFITKRVYNEHMNALHSDSPKTLYTCELCGSKFLHLHSYAAHKKAHGKFSYICEHCGKEITQPNYIKIHLRTHTGDKPFQCPYCEKRFNNGSYMRRHIMFHTKQFAYECQDCGKGFPSRKPYLLHREKEHNDMSSTETCDVCQSLVEGNDKSAAYVMHRHRVHGEQLPRKVPTVKLGRKFDYNFSSKDDDMEEEGAMAVETITADITPETYLDNIEGAVSQTIEIVTIETI